MKKIMNVFMLMSFLALFSVTASHAQIVVRVRPVAPVIVERPHAPSARHVWVAEEWVPSGGTYVYKAGYWSLPPRPGAVWIPGHWRHPRRGYGWVPGHWRY